MGWAVIGRSNIELDGVINRVKVELELKRLAKEKGISLSDYASGEETIYFDIIGNKMIDYTMFDELFEWGKTNNIKMEISIIEYVEDTGSGYYKNSFEEECD